MASATMTSPALNVGPLPDFEEDFREACREGVLPDGWTTYGCGHEPAGKWAEYFGSSGEAPYYRAYSISGVKAAWSNSTFKYAEAADEWLVTPAIHITDDAQILQFTANAYGGFENNRYRVLISETGQGKDSFKVSPLINTTLRGTTTEACSKTSYVPLTGYAGKDIWLAFVNKSTDADLLGFNNIVIAPYSISIVNQTPNVLPEGSMFAIGFNADVRVPVDVNSFLVTLSTTDGHQETTVVEQKCSVSGARFSVTFPEMALPAEGLGYTVTITPAYENAPATVIEGEVNVPFTSYPPVAVIEEFTGTWCTNCPRGSAFMAYYHDKYSGENGGCKAIGIALHDKSDPMFMRNCDYFNDAYTVSGAQGFPSAFFNRKKLGDPSDKNVVEEIAMSRSNSRIDIKKVACIENEPVNVDFTIEHSYAMRNMNCRVSLVVVENNVNQNKNKYEQSNGFSGVTQKAIENTYGEELWPYFKFYCESPQLIEAKDMTYDHVARYIYPNYQGELVQGECEAVTPIGMSMSFDMPGNVINIENTAVIALLMNADTGEIIGASEMEYHDFNTDHNYVESIESDFVSMAKTYDNKIELSSNAEVTLSLYGSDGSILYESSDYLRHHIVDGRAYTGVVIARAASRDGKAITKKFVF